MFKSPKAARVSRRGFLALTAAATSALSFWRAFAAPVTRHVEPSPSKPLRSPSGWVPGVKSVHFDGLTYLQNNGLPMMRGLSSSKFLLSFWYKGIFPGNYRGQNILLTQPGGYTIVLARLIPLSQVGQYVV